MPALVTEAEKANVHADGLRFIRAYDHRRAKRYAEGLEEILKVPDELETPRRQHLLGQLLEGTGAYDGAFAAFERMNAISRENDPIPARGARATDRADGPRRSATPLARLLDLGKPRKRMTGQPGFLVGFPRSGTTFSTPSC